METHLVDEQFEAERILPSFLDACANRESTGNINLPDDCGNFLLPNFGKSSCSTSYAWSVGKDKYRELLVSAINDLASGRHGDFRQLTGFSARPSDVELLIASVRELQCLIFTRTLDWYECSVRHIDSPLDLLRLKMLSRHVDIYDSWYAPLHRIIGRLELYIPDDDANESRAWHFAQASCVLLSTAQYFEATVYLGNLASLLDSWQRYLCGAGNLSHAEADDVARSIEARRAWLDFHSETVGEYVYDLNDSLEEMGIIPTIFKIELHAHASDPRHNLYTTMLLEDSGFLNRFVSVDAFNRVSMEIFHCPELADLYFRGDGRVMTSPDRAREVAEKLKEFVAQKRLHKEFVVVPLSLQL